MRVGTLILSWLVIVTMSVQGQDTATTPYLVFDAGGHTAAVNKVRFLDNDHVASVSNDKTLRLWSVRTGESLDVFRPPIGSGRAGTLYALAISPDRQRLAVGGYEFDGSNHGIYLIDLPDRQIRHVLRGHTNVIIDLAFSEDGRWLASASADKTARIWDLESRRCHATLRGHQQGVYAVVFSPDSQYLATASLDMTARVWPLSATEKATILRGHEAPVQAIDWSPDGQRLATGGVDQAIHLWSPDGRLIRRIEKLGNHVTSVRFRRNSRELFFTLGGDGDRDGGFIIDLVNHQSQLSCNGHENSVLDGDVSRNGSLVATADANGEIFLWRVDDGKLLHRLRSKSRRAWRAAWDEGGRAIAWGGTSDYVHPNQRGPLETAFQLTSLEWLPLEEISIRAARTQGQPIRLESVEAQAVTANYPNGRATRLELNSPYDQVRCYALLDERTAVIGSDFGLTLFDLNSARPSRQLVGHLGTVWAVAASPDGRLLLSAADDQTLRVWNWRQGQLLVSLFFAGRQWIAWTPQGYYAASPGGEHLMGWLVNRGRDQLGSFYPAAQFHKSLYQPELIRRLAEVGSVQQALADLNAELPADLSQDREPAGVQEVLPPEVKIVEPQTSPVEIAQASLTVRAVARSRGDHQVTTLRLLLNGRPYEGRKGVYVVPTESSSAEEATAQWQIALTPGQHRLTVLAETDVSNALSDGVEVVYREVAATEAARLPDLYVLAVGVSEYAGPLRLNFADKDAHLLATTLQQVSGSLFRNVQLRLLTNAQATRRDMLQGLSWLRREMTQQDVAVFFFSGHGAKDETGNFYLVPVDGEPADLLSTAVSGSQFKDALAALPGRVLVLLDACHAGSAGGDRRKAVYIMTDDLVRDLVTDDYGVIVMCSSMGREYSLESDEHQQGFFTMALIEALTGKSDFNGDGLVYITEIDAYLSDRVKTLTQGQQHPVTTKPTTIRSFPLSKPPAD